MKPIILLIALVFVSDAATRDRADVPEAAVARAAETARIQTHLDGALSLLATRDLSGLSAPQLSARAALVRTLTEYRNAGRFPVNRYVRNQRVPVFVDPVTGVHCAVGHLMASTGEHALVARIAAENNLVRIAELADDPEVVAWLDAHGLTLVEAARIQPAYDGFPPPDDTRPANDRWAPSRSVTVSMIGLSVGAAAFGLTREPSLGMSTTSALSLTAGILSVVVGLAGLPTGTRTSGVDAVTPAAAILAGTGAILVARHLIIPRARTPEEAGEVAPRASVAPLFPSSGSGAGVVVSIRF